MNIKEEAKKLVSKFENHTSTEFDEADEGEYRAIQCALICVDEMYLTLLSIIGNDGWLWKSGEKEKVEHLQNLKAEIEKL